MGKGRCHLCARCAIGCVALVSTLGVCAPAGAQTGPVGWLDEATERRTVSFMRMTYKDYPTSAPSTPIEGAEGVEVFISELNTDLVVLSKVNLHGSLLGLRLLYGWLNLDYGEFAKQEDLPRFDRAIYLEFDAAYRGRYAGRWGFQARITPGMSGDLDTDVYTSEVTLHGGLWGLNYPSDAWAIGLGAVRTYDFGTPRVLPSLILEYDRGPGWHVLVELPTLATVSYDVGRGFDLGAVFDVTGHRYARDKESFPDITDPYATHSVTSLGALGGYRFDRLLYFRLEAGYMFDRNLRLLEGDEDVLIIDPKEGGFLRAIVVFGGN